MFRYPIGYCHVAQSNIVHCCVRLFTWGEGCSALSPKWHLVPNVIGASNQKWRCVLIPSVGELPITHRRAKQYFLDWLSVFVDKISRYKLKARMSIVSKVCRSHVSPQEVFSHFTTWQICKTTPWSFLSRLSRGSMACGLIGPIGWLNRLDQLDLACCVIAH